MEFNIFSKPSNDFNFMLKVGGEDLFVNGTKQRAIITNPDIKEFNDKYISTTFKTMRGDYVYYNNMYWMIWNQVTVPRAEAYKGIMRQAEHDVIFNLYYAGVTSDYLLKLPAILQRTSDYTPRYDQMMTLVDSEIHVFVRDTASTRRINKLVGIPNGKIVIGKRAYEITGISYEKKGYLDITCKMSTGNTATDYTNNIYWSSNGAISGWANEYDLSFYGQESDNGGEPTPTLPDAPNGYQTSLTLTVTASAQTNEQTGAVTATWSAEANKETYKAFNGYKVRLLSNGTEVATEVLGVDVLTYTFSNVSVGDYTVEVYARFAENNTILPQIATTTVEDNSAPVVPKPSDEVTQVTAQYYNDTNSNGPLIWTPEVDKNKYSGFYGYRVEVYSSTLFGGDILQDYWVVTTEQCNIRTGWSGENGWYVTIQSIFYTPEEQIMQPYRIEGTALTSLPDEEGGWGGW